MVLNFLLTFNPLILIVVTSIIISVIMVIVYKYMTDQDLMKRLKEEIKELQNEMKSLRDNPAKMGEVNKRAMETNMKYMMHSMKPTLVTFIPIILIFGWLNGNIAFDPLTVGNDFSVELEFYDGTTGQILVMTPEGIMTVNGELYTIADNSARIVFRPELAGTYTLQYSLVNDAGETLKTWENTVLVVEEGQRGYEKTPDVIKDEILKTIKVNLQKFRPFGSEFTVPVLNWQPGWITLYILISLVCSIGLRKALNVY
jgi:uncharacterized membrane protein (DUF106 family)